MRRIWLRRNEFVFENNLSNPFKVNHIVTKMLTTFKSTREAAHPEIDIKNNEKIMLKKPENNYIKIN